MEALCTELHDALSKVFTIVRDKASTDELAAVATNVAVLLVKAKMMLQEAFEESEELKKQSAEARSRLDATYLQLQNLLYERDYFRGEIRANQNFRYAWEPARLPCLTPCAPSNRTSASATASYA